MTASATEIDVTVTVRTRAQGNSESYVPSLYKKGNSTARSAARKATYPPCTRRETAPREARPEKLRTRRETAPREARPQKLRTKKGDSAARRAAAKSPYQEGRQLYGAKIVRKVMYHGVSCYLSRSSSNHICLLARRVLPPFLVRRFGTYIGFSTYVPARKILCNGNIDFSC